MAKIEMNSMSLIVGRLFQVLQREKPVSIIKLASLIDRVAVRLSYANSNRALWFLEANSCMRDLLRYKFSTFLTKRGKN